MELAESLDKRRQKMVELKCAFNKLLLFQSCIYLKNYQEFESQMCSPFDQVSHKDYYAHVGSTHSVLGEWRLLTRRVARRRFLGLLLREINYLVQSNSIYLFFPTVYELVCIPFAFFKTFFKRYLNTRQITCLIYILLF